MTLASVDARTADVTVVILSYNEELHIERAIASVKSFARDILVVDSFSSDRTVELAIATGGRVVQNPFINHAKQFQWAIDNGNIQTAWIMRLDADEVIAEDLSREISQKLPALPMEVVGIRLNRKHVFMGRWIRHGGRYPLHLLRIWRNGHGRVEDRWMDEHVLVWGGETISFKGGFADINLNDLSFFTDKHNKYATKEAVEVLAERYDLFSSRASGVAGSAPKQAIIKRFIKNRIYNALPFWVGPLGYFILRYVLQLGFLDRREGLIYHLLQGFWYRFLVASKVIELERLLSRCSTNVDRISIISHATGLQL